MAVLWACGPSLVVFPKPREAVRPGWEDWLFFCANSAFRALSSVAACFLNYAIVHEKKHGLLIQFFQYKAFKQEQWNSFNFKICALSQWCRVSLNKMCICVDSVKLCLLDEIVQCNFGLYKKNSILTCK